MPSIPDPGDADWSEWLTPEFVNHYVAAYNERRPILDAEPVVDEDEILLGYDLGFELGTLSAGTDGWGDVLSVVQYIQGRIMSVVCVPPTWDGGEALMDMSWADDADPPAGDPPGQTPGNVDLRRLADLPFYDGVRNFTRRRPEYVAALDSAVMSSGATADVGDVAIWQGLDRHRYYQWTGTEWVPHPTDPRGAVPRTWETGGAAEAGDYIGPWIFEELKACLLLIVRQRYPATIDEEGAFIYLAGDTGATWAAAKAAADATGSVSAGLLDSLMWNTTGTYTIGATKPYSARATAVEAPVEVIAPPLGAATANVSVIMFGWTFPGMFSSAIFDANGVTGLTDEEWAIVATQLATEGGVVSQTVGNTDSPTWCDEPPTVPGSAGTERGCYYRLNLGSGWVPPLGLIEYTFAYTA